MIEPVSRSGDDTMLCQEADPCSVSGPVLVMRTAVYSTGCPGRSRSIFSARNRFPSSLLFISESLHTPPCSSSVP